MVPFYNDKSKLFVAVDCIIFGFNKNGLNLLILKRNMEPAKGEWSLPGGFLEYNESLNDAAHRVLNELTGLDHVYMEQVEAFGETNRDPGERVISVAYYALIDLQDQDISLLNKYNACWVNTKDLPLLIFDHKEMVEKALITLRKRTTIEPIGFNLLPDKFTMPQLQALYEAIYDVQLDKRNFRKKILKMGILDKLEEKEKASSKKGAFYFRFNLEKYNHLLYKEYNFTV